MYMTATTYRAIAAIAAVVMLTAAAPYWYQMPYCPYAYSNANGTRIRIYTGSGSDYAEAVVTYHGTATPQKVAAILKQAIKQKTK